MILVALWRFDKTHPPENGLFYLQGLLYCGARFKIEFFRETRPTVWGLTLAQWACVAGFCFFAVRMTRLLRQSRADDAALPALS